MEKQNKAFLALKTAWEDYKKQNNIKWYNLIFPSKELKHVLDGFHFRAWSIQNYPEYLGEDGRGLNEVEVDLRMGRDMSKYGWRPEEVEKARKNPNKYFAKMNLA